MNIYEYDEEGHLEIVKEEGRQLHTICQMLIQQDTQDSRLHLQTVRMLMCSEQETAQASVDLVLMLML